MSRKHENPKGKTRDVNAANRAALALQLRAQKLTYEEIAQRCGYASKGACHNAIQRELQRVVVDNVDELRREEADGLNQLEAECWKRLYSEEHEKAMLFAVDRIIAIKERRARLFGLDVSTNGNIAAAQVVVRAMPPGYLGEEQAG
jgi:hypothetical protein